MLDKRAVLIREKIKTIGLTKKKFIVIKITVIFITNSAGAGLECKKRW